VPWCWRSSAARSRSTEQRHERDGEDDLADAERDAEVGRPEELGDPDAGTEGREE